MKIQQAARCGILLGLSGFLSLNVAAQQLKLGNNPAVIKKDAILELNSANQGLLLPRVLKSEILTGGKLFNADDGMLVFVNDAAEKSLYIKRNGAWEKVSNISNTTLTGPVTGSGAGTIATTITDQAVTYAKIQNVTTQSLLGRYAGTTGTTQEIKLGTGLLLNNTTGLLTADAGTNLWNANKLQGLNIATTAPTNGQVLKWNSTTSVWEPGAPSAASTITLTGPVTGSGTSSIATTITNKAISYAHIQDVTSQKLLGRYAATNGATQEVTISTGLLLNNSTGNLTADAANNLWNANKLQSRNIATTAPTAGQVLKWNSTTSVWEPDADLNGGATYGTLASNDIGTADAPGASDRMKIWASNVSGTPTNGPLGTSASSWNVLSFKGGGYTTQLFFDKNNIAVKEWGGNAAPLTNNTYNPWYKVVMTHGNNSFTDGGIIFAGKTEDASTEVRQDAANFFWDNTTKRLGIGTNSPSSALQVNGAITGTSLTVTNGVTSNTLDVAGNANTGSLNVNGSYTGKVTVLTGTTLTLNDTHFAVIVRRTGNTDVTITLPNATTCTGRMYYISRDFATGNGDVNITAPSSQYSRTLTGTYNVGVMSTGTKWITISYSNN